MVARLGLRVDIQYVENISFVLQITDEMIKVVRFIEKITHWGQGKNQSSTKGSIVTVLEDITDGDVAKNLITPTLEAPKLIVFISESTVKGIYVVADTVLCEVEITGGITSALMCLMAMHVLLV